MIHFFILIGLIALDQITKYLAYNMLRDIGQIHIIQNFFSLTYVENRGAAFGILYGNRLFLVLFTSILLTSLFIYYLKLPAVTPSNKLARLSLVLIAAGGIGNLIDRILLGYVIDFLHFTFINFPVFNIADILIVVGVFLNFILTIFFIKD